MHDILNNILTPYFLALLVATGIGFIIGLEREFSDSSDGNYFAGIRTFPLVAILGSSLSYLSSGANNLLLPAAVIGFIFFAAIVYFIRAGKGQTSLTNEVALILTLILGIFSGLHYFREALGAAVVCTIILSLKGQFRTIISKLTQEEIYAFLKFWILAFLLLPFLPDENFGPGKIINPRDIGWIVVIVSSLGLIGYLLIKFVGAKRGILLTAFFGGMFSSTAVAWVFSTRSKITPELSKSYSAGIILASSIMFIRVSIISAIFNTTVFIQLLIPCLLMAVSGFVASYILARKSKTQSSTDEIELGNPLNLLNAFGFAALYIAITFAVFYGNQYFGNAGLFVSGIISGLTDVDAINISMSKFALTDGKTNVAVLVIMLAILSNSIVKLGISIVKGSTETKKQVGISMAVTLTLGLIYVLIKYFNT